MTDRTLNSLRRKLEEWELAHLRQHCTELAERLNRAEERAADGEYWAEHWRENAFQLQRDLMDDGVQIGITQDGEMFPLPPDSPSDAPVTKASAEALVTPPNQDHAFFNFDDIEAVNQDPRDPPAPPDPEPSATQFPAEWQAALREWVFAQVLDFSILDAVRLGLQLDAQKLTKWLMQHVRIALLSFGCKTTERRDSYGLKWYTPPVLANETTLKLSSPENRPLKVLCDDGDPLCGQSA